ncbi:hypothetical protein NMY22_g14695 [Coprinellus aureogranulatus]|nr:hypothetical protein NMY22_g14695 [Coprinellus aureogranulatus]
MRVNFGLIPIAIAAYGWVVSAQEFASNDFFEARELVDEFTKFERRSDILSDFTTRELVDELSDRLERRGQKPTKPKTYKCVYCGRAYPTFEQAKFCGSNSVLTGGCRPVGS